MTTTISDWAFHDISLHHSGAGYGGQLRGRPAVLQQQLGSGQQFCGGGGACVRPCGEALDSGKIQVSSDGSTWSDSTATRSVESAATDFEFGQLAANETLAAQALPVQTYNGSMRGDRMFAHYRFTTGGDDWPAFPKRPV